MSRAALKGPAEVEVEIIMSRAGGTHSTAFLVVEGDDDSRFFSRRVDAECCEVVIAGGKLAVIGGLERLDRRKFRGALGVVDDDGDRLLGRPVPSANVVRVTGGCDLDAFLIWSDSLDPVVGEYADPRKLREVGGVDAVRRRLGEIGSVWGRLRIVARAQEWGLDLAKFGPRRFVSPRWEVDESALREAIRCGLKESRSAVEARLASVTCEDPRLLCQGHDLLDLLSLALERGKGLLSGARSVSAEQLGAALRIGLSAPSWNRSGIAGDVRRWEADCVPYRILPVVAPMTRLTL